jgi:hypothetical protein
MRIPTIQKLIDFTLSCVGDLRDPRQREIRFDRPLQRVKDALTGVNSAETVGRAASALETLAAWESIHGAASVLSGDLSGWERLNLARRYQYWNLRIVRARQRAAKSSKPRLELQTFALALAHSIVDDDVEATAWLGGELVNGMSDKSIGFDHGTPFEPFMARLFQFHVRGQAERFESGGIYGKLLASMVGSDDEFVSAISGACDYHLSQTGRADDQGFPEFASAPYFVFPVEILATMKLRGRQSLSELGISHPLLQTRLADPHLMVAPSEELSMLIRRAKESLPDL